MTMTSQFFIQKFWPSLLVSLIKSPIVLTWLRNVAKNLDVNLRSMVPSPREACNSTFLAYKLRKHSHVTRNFGQTLDVKFEDACSHGQKARSTILREIKEALSLVQGNVLQKLTNFVWNIEKHGHMNTLFQFPCPILGQAFQLRGYDSQFSRKEFSNAFLLVTTPFKFSQKKLSK